MGVLLKVLQLSSLVSVYSVLVGVRSRDGIHLMNLAEHFKNFEVTCFMRPLHDSHTSCLNVLCHVETVCGSEKNSHQYCKCSWTTVAEKT